MKSRKKVSWKNLNSDTNEKIINISTEVKSKIKNTEKYLLQYNLSCLIYKNYA